MSSDLKVTNIKHESSSSNNLVLGSDGTTTVSGALTASGGIKVADGGNIGSASDTDAISISSGGYVIHSARPYFDVRGNQGDPGTDVAQNNRIPFNTVITNNGSHFSTTGHYFLTPVAGVYYFHVQIYSYDSATLMDWQIISSDTSDGNDATLSRLRHTAQGSDEMYHLTAISYLSANRRIGVENNRSSNRMVYLGGDTHTRFQGSLIG